MPAAQTCVEVVLSAWESHVFSFLRALIRFSQKFADRLVNVAEKYLSVVRRKSRRKAKRASSHVIVVMIMPRDPLHALALYLHSFMLFRDCCGLYCQL